MKQLSIFYSASIQARLMKITIGVLPDSLSLGELFLYDTNLEIVGDVYGGSRKYRSMVTGNFSVNVSWTSNAVGILKLKMKSKKKWAN